MLRELLLSQGAPRADEVRRGRGDLAETRAPSGFCQASGLILARSTTLGAPVQNTRILVGAATVIGLGLLVVALVYLIEPARSLPGAMPGHEAGSSHHHVKHGIAALVVALGAFALAWFQSGPRKTVSTSA